jgi:hypothetical protein
MIAMQYAMRFPAGLEAAKARVRSRKPLFAGRSGLDHKFYLYDPQENIYAPIYLWSDHVAAQKFLLDPLFGEVIGSLGRPRVRSWMVLSFVRGSTDVEPVWACVETDKVAPNEDLAKLAEKEEGLSQAKAQNPDLFARLVGLDPDRWEITRLSFWSRRGAVDSEADCTLSFDVIGYAP